MCESVSLFDNVLEDWVQSQKNKVEKVVEPTYVECNKNLKNLKRKRSETSDYPEYKMYIKCRV